MNRRFGHKAIKESYITEANYDLRSIVRHSEILGKQFKICTDARIQKVGNMYKKLVSRLSLTTVVNMRSFASLSREQEQRL